MIEKILLNTTISCLQHSSIHHHRIIFNSLIQSREIRFVKQVKSNSSASVFQSPRGAPPRPNSRYRLGSVHLKITKIHQRHVRRTRVNSALTVR